VKSPICKSMFTPSAFAVPFTALIFAMALTGCNNGFKTQDEIAAAFDAASVSPQPSASPSPVKSPTPGPSPSVSPSPTIAPSPTPTVSPTASPVPSPSPSPVVTPTPSPTPVVTPKLQFFGRFDFSTGATTPRMSWVGASVVAHFKGSSLKVKLNSTGWFVSVIDNGNPQRFKVNGNQTITLADTLTFGDHKVTVMLDSEGSFINASQFLGFDYGNGGSLQAPDETVKAVRIEIIGDSITCGFGNLGQNATCPFSIDTSSAYASYSQIASRSLGANPATQICISGHGMVRATGAAMGSTGETTLPQAFPYALAPLGGNAITGPQWTFPSKTTEQPNVVVVNLGTNDFWDGQEPPTYRSGTVAFVKQIRARYPDAHIFLAVGAMTQQPETALKAAITTLKSAGENKVYFLKFDLQQNVAGGIGCQYHPGKLTHEIMGQTLVTAIRQALGI
jgi:lysophospholipase L1-like esterase